MSIGNAVEASQTVAPLEHVSELTGAKIRTFLFEVAEGVSNYKSLHSLTQQVEHQYHGRFLIELIQNAHDALPDVREIGCSSRIAIVLDPSDSLHGSLLVANDGQPFTSSNFERLSQLGQSDKDPQKSIGNKGLGFRSVLEISERPEVYSRAHPASERFDGYCFAFEPEVVHSLVSPMEELAAGLTIPLSPVSGAPLVDWQEGLISKFRARIRKEGADWLKAESKYLSPYLLPVPRKEIRSERVASLEKEGFATVVRLPLKSAEANKLVRELLARLSSSTLLFLERVSALELYVDGQSRQVVTRSVAHIGGPFGQQAIRITDGADEARNYYVWTREVRVEDAPFGFQAALKGLPGRWPEIQELPVSIAVRLQERPEAGVFSIYMPTELPTGGALYINAPFYGDMSRTAISFDDPYNLHLLQTAGELTAEVVRHQLAGMGQKEARAIVDMICPFGSDRHASERWQKILFAAVEGAGGSIDDESLILAESGWRPLNATSLVPETSAASILTEDRIRQHATFDIFHPCLSSRYAQLIELTTERYPGEGAYPQIADLEGTVASIASELHREGGDWNAFWNDVSLLLPNGQKELAKHEIILGSDGRLHKADGEGHVFFIPRQGTTDDADEQGFGGASGVPLSLQSSIAFLSETIEVYDPARPNVQTPLRSYLFNGGLVSQFRIETIFADVLQAATPPLPIAHNTSDAERCRDILSWSLRLIAGVVARGRGSDATLSLLRPIAVPCLGGWFAMSDASFGEGWPGTSGQLLGKYLSLLPGTVGRAALDRVLLPLNHSAWSESGHEARDLLRKGGVFDGLRLEEVGSAEWSSEFRASASAVTLPFVGPSSLTPDFWSDYRTQAERQLKVTYISPQAYTVGPVRHFPGMSRNDLGVEARLALYELMLQSLPNWPKGWDTQVFYKRTGYADKPTSSSALFHYLKTQKWLAILSAKEEVTWSQPSQRWHIPAEMISKRASHFAHLRALPYDLSRRFDTHEELADQMHRLGMPYLDLHSETGNPLLLNELVSAIGSDEAPDPNVLVGQIRDAWHRYRPGTNESVIARLPVRDQNRQLEAVLPDGLPCVYLPDRGTLASELGRFGLRVVEINTEDARALRDWFSSSYGSAVIPTSQLKVVPLIGETEWNGIAASPFDESDLGWLMVPMLALVSSHSQICSVHSNAFQERLALLKEACVEWAPQLDVAVMSGTEEIIRTPVFAHWDAGRKTILLSEACKSHPDEMCEALSLALKRDDLELPLRMILSGVNRVDEAPNNLPVMLSTLRVSDEQLRLVVEHLRGDVGHAARLIQILLHVIAPPEGVPDVSNAESDVDVEAGLSAAGVADSDAKVIFRLATQSQDVYSFGASVSRKLGGIPELSHWNDALVRLGRPKLLNREWMQQLQINLEEAQGLIKRIIAALVSRSGNAFSFRGFLTEYEDFPPKDLDLSEVYWSVDFAHTMEIVAQLVASWPGGDQVARSIRGATCALDLRQRLVEAGIDVERDPDECCRSNYQLVSRVMEALERMRQSWVVKTNGDGHAQEWRSARDSCVIAIKSEIDGRAYTTALTEADILSVAVGVHTYKEAGEFHDALAEASDLISLQVLLGLSSVDLENTDDRIAYQRAEAQRRRRVVSICGEEFDASEENRTALRQFVVDRIKFSELASAQPLDVGKAAGLLPIKAAMRHDRLGAGRAGGKKPATRQTKAVDEVVGLMGEIFVFEMLKRQYGAEVVTASSWVSGNSRYVFEDNAVDDGMGCDFSLSVRGRRFFVEVKATGGEDESFTLGSSEIALAMNLASERKARRGRFILVHVKNVLSRNPRAVVLPNPYDSKSSNVFTIEDADARIRYKSRP